MRSDATNIAVLLNAPTSLSREEVILRLRVALQNNLTYLDHRPQRKRPAPYDAAVIQALEAIASTLRYLAQQEDRA